MPTIQERLTTGLLAMGFEAHPGKSGKYHAFYRNELDKQGRHVYLFIGSNGALRKGHCASDSYSIGCPSMPSTAFKIILEKGDAVLNKPIAFEGF